MLEGSKVGSPIVTHVSPSHPRKFPRIKVLEKWKVPAGLRGKITLGFEKQPALQESPSQQSNGAPEEPTSELSPARTIPATPNPNVSAGKQQRRRRRKQAKKEAASPTPNDLKEASQELSSDASPYIHPTRVSRKPKQSILAMDLSVVKDTKTTTDAVQSKEAMSVNTSDVMQFQDRRRNYAAVST